MEVDSGTALQAVRQQLEADRLLGIRSVPISLPEPVPSRPGKRDVRIVDPEVVAQKAEQLRALDENDVRNCTKCDLCKTRTKTVFGVGDPCARLVFVGEAPGHDEDKQGVAFVGRAGQLLTRMIIAMGLTREQVFICNVLKCRPPDNRDPMADEILACGPYLERQLQIIEPEVLVALGAPAAKTLLNTAASIGKLRGRFHDYYPSGLAGAAIPTMPTYHPAYLLRSPGEKGKVWKDLQMVMDVLGLPLPDRKRS